MPPTNAPTHPHTPTTIQQAKIHSRFEYFPHHASYLAATRMPAVDDQTRRMAKLLGATDEELLEEDDDAEMMSKSFFDESGRMSTIVGLEGDADRELRTQK